MEFVTSIEKASEWGVTKRMVNYWCARGKIKGAQKSGSRWKIPMDAERPDRQDVCTALIDYVVRIEGGTTVSIGNQDFEDIRSKDMFYVDKTSFIQQWWETGDRVTLITRPRRFGKTLNLSMTECFFSMKYAGRTELFEGLKIWESEKYRKLQGTYPVIFLSFASVKEDNYKSALKSINFEIWNIFREYRDILDMGVFTQDEQDGYGEVSWDMDEETAFKSLKLLTNLLYKYYGKKPVILLDEYDTPMIEAYFSGYWDEMVRFMRIFFNNTFKSNPYMEKALLTGITIISKESMFSDMNHLDVATPTTCKYETAFGFTENEVQAALEHVGLRKYKRQVKEWYDGYVIGRCRDVYNPWTITKFMDSGGIFDTYWANTSSNTLVNTLVGKGSRRLKCDMEDLINGIPVKAYIDENIDFAELEYDENAVWGLLYTTGYLKADSVDDDLYTLSLVNGEVKKMFTKMFRKWFANGGYFGDFQKALLVGDVEAMNYYMEMVAKATFSYFDCGSGLGIVDVTERFYHGFVLGLLVELSNEFLITSNRESGIGRYDIMMESRDEKNDSIIIEFKVLDKKKDKDLSDCAKRALMQIEEKQYAEQLVARGVDENRIKKYGFAFEGKKVYIEERR